MLYCDQSVLERAEERTRPQPPWFTIAELQISSPFIFGPIRLQEIVAGAINVQFAPSEKILHYRAQIVGAEPGKSPLLAECNMPYGYHWEFLTLTKPVSQCNVSSGQEI
ncbi:Hypothetical predicted protein [Pelobates cultripes]|uniref:Uncharacterized protein n=1 Tax=Pelobates cultripes TaxID=61616 RepID=A0AAD1WTI0_PELCU|nr:Hypothetical predicted protein [Pelobates cultripes]